MHVRFAMTSFAPMTTRLTSSRSSTRAASARCGHRLRKTATSRHHHDRRPSEPRNRPPNHRPNRRPRNPNHASVVDRSVVFRASDIYRRRSRLQRRPHRERRQMEKAFEARWHRQLPQPNRRRWKRQNSTSSRR